MYPSRRIYPFRSRLRRGWATAVPWIFVLGIVVGTTLPGVRQWLDRPGLHRPSVQSSRLDSELLLSRIDAPAAKHPTDVLWVIDGDTFEARIHLPSGPALVTRVRLRGVDAPELKAACSEELRMAQAATRALRALLAEGEIAVFNIGPDKYSGRVVADVATRRTPNVSSALLATGLARRYDGGHRRGWCGPA